MKNVTPLLVRTPEQVKGESSLGFVLRVSEANGYETPRHLFSMAKSTRSEMFTVGLDTTKLARIFGRSADTLAGYRAPNEADLSRVVLCGHSLTPYDLDLSVPKVCPECISEHGFIPAWADLTLADACPIHKRLLMNVCPVCRKKLSWFRPGLLQCTCGANLGAAETAPISAEHAAMLFQVVAKATGDTTQNPCAMPVSQFEATTLLGLIGMAKSMARFDRATNKAQFWSVAASAGALFSHWPNNLFAALHKLVPSGAADKGMVKLRQHFDGTYRIILKDIAAADDIAFLREAITKFSDRLKSGDSADIQPIGTERALFAKPTAQATAIAQQRNPSLTRHFKKCAPGQRSIGIRDAARRIGIPVSVLRSLRQRGYFEVQHKTSRVVSFHEADLAAFEAKIAAFHRGLPASTNTESLTLERVWNLKFKFQDGKGLLAAAVLDGTIPSSRSDIPGIGGILIDKAQVESFIAQCRSQAYGDTITPTEVRKLLHCDPMVVPDMVSTGHLDGCWYEAGLRVTRASVVRFGSEFRSLASLAKEQQTTTRRLKRRSAALKVSLLEFQRPNGIGPQPFVSVSDYTKLEVNRE